MLFSRHSGWVKMEAQVVMAVLILSWAKLFQRESKALPHCWRGCLSTIFPFVSSRSNPTLYFSFLSPPCHLSLRLQNSFMRSFSHYELTSLSPRSLFALSTSFLPSFLPSFLFFFQPCIIPILTSHQVSHFLSPSSDNGIQAWQLSFGRTWCFFVFFRDQVGCRWRVFGWVVLESRVNRATVCLHLCFISAHYNAHLEC